ncbi:MAG: glutamine--fructose-6-phosphate transaminase (isomerizing), partial [Minisyncoccales bacterium]
MCGIIGYIGNKKATPILMNGLKHLQYRGYDSAGIATLNNKKRKRVRATGKLINLKEKLKDKTLEGNCGLGHVRWATNGKVTKENTHPHSDCEEKLYLVHNGIIENYKEIKKKLKKKGHKFNSETDTEVIAHLIEHFFEGNLEKAVQKSLYYLKGAYAFVVVHKDDPNKMVAARFSSPLIVGIKDNEYFIGSDPSVLLPHTNKVIPLKNEEVVTLTKNDIEIRDKDNLLKEREPKELDMEVQEAKKKGHSHFMLKEIFEEPDAVKDSIRGRTIEEKGLAKLGGLIDYKNKINDIERIIIVACGTAYYAGLVGEYMIENYAKIPVEVEVGSEFRYRNPVIDKKTAVLAVSQSGETADTLAAIEEAKRKGALTLGSVNVVGSSVARETEAGVYNHIGPEIGVASTKAFISQMTILGLLTVFLGRERDMSVSKGKEIIKEIKKVPELAEKTLSDNKDKIKKLAQKYKKFNNFFFFGRKFNYPIAVEGALKLTEVSYLHAESYPAGELKHGPIALIDKNFPSFFLAPDTSV